MLGAEAVLKLRTFLDNGDLSNYWTFHTRREHVRLYPIPGQRNYDLTA
ncbi:hypothetical protein ABZ904_32470 [Streptomyces sp. NPDC046900]